MIDDNWMTSIPDMGATMRAMEDARRADLDRRKHEMRGAMMQRTFSSTSCRE